MIHRTNGVAATFFSGAAILGDNHIFVIESVQ